MPPPKVIYPKRTDPPDVYDYRRWKEKFSYEQRVQYLHLIRLNGRFHEAAEKMKVPLRVVLKARKDDPDFDEACEIAKQSYVDAVLVKEATRRALEGVEVPMIGRVGKDEDGIICHQRKYSDSLLQFLMRAARGEFRNVAEANPLPGKGTGTGGKYDAPTGGVLMIPADRPATPSEWEAKYKSGQSTATEDPTQCSPPNPSSKPES